MSMLLRKPFAQPLPNGVQMVQEVTSQNSDLQYIEMRVLELQQGAKYKEALQRCECCIVALSGEISVTAGTQHFSSVGTRKHVFEKIPTDSVYVPIDEMFTITTTDATAKVVLCYAPTTEKKEITLIEAAHNGVEHRGQAQNQRLVHNILPDTSPVAASLLVVEVYTDSGNWSSYPPHKHDVANLPHESLLEETYYHEINPTQGFVFQRVYTEDRTLDETMAVEHGDVVLVPKGYHPVSVPDGYDGYYLNIMAGPERIWKFHNEAAHKWLLSRK